LTTTIRPATNINYVANAIWETGVCLQTGAGSAEEDAPTPLNGARATASRKKKHENQKFKSSLWQPPGTRGFCRRRFHALSPPSGFLHDPSSVKKPVDSRMGVFYT
jgi:hypothetical protein